jgi:acyl-CoA-binding protein
MKRNDQYTQQHPHSRHHPNHPRHHHHTHHHHNHTQQRQHAIDSSFAEVTSVHIFNLNQARLAQRDKLQLYALYKQATEGDANFTFLASFDAKKLAWQRMKGDSAAVAKLKYVELFHRLQQQALQSALRVAKLQSRNTPQRQAWERSEHRPQAMEPLVDKGFSSVYLDQLTPTLLQQYYANSKAKFLQAANGKTRSDLMAARPHCPVKNSEMAELFGDFHFSRFLHPLAEIEVLARSHYQNLFTLEPDSTRQWFVADLSTVYALPVRESDHSCVVPTVLLFEMAQGLHLRAIACKNLAPHAPNLPVLVPAFPHHLEQMQVLYPHDGLAWELAKLHTLHNAHYSMVTGIHALLHFPLSSPVAIVVETMLPDEAPALARGVLARLLKAHSYLQVALDAHAMHSEDSVLYAVNLPYSAWCFQADQGEGIVPLIRLITDGWPASDGSTHPLYPGRQDFSQMPHHYGLGKYRKIVWRLKQVVDEFVADVCQTVANDAQEVAFARQFLAQLLPALPSNSFFRQTEAAKTQPLALLQTILSCHILNTIQHSIDHGLQESRLCNNMPLIIRKPIDFKQRSQDMALITHEVAQINTLVDRSRAHMAANVFFHSHISRSLPDFFAHGGYFPADQAGYLPVMQSSQRNDALQLRQAQFANSLLQLLNDEDCPVDAGMIGVSIQS